MNKIHKKVLRLSRRHHKLEFQVETNQEQGKSLSEQPGAGDEEKVKSAGKKKKRCAQKTKRRQFWTILKDNSGKK